MERVVDDRLPTRVREHEVTRSAPLPQRLDDRLRRLDPPAPLPSLRRPEDPLVPLLVVLPRLPHVDMRLMHVPPLRGGRLTPAHAGRGEQPHERLVPVAHRGVQCKELPVGEDLELGTLGLREPDALRCIHGDLSPLEGVAEDRRQQVVHVAEGLRGDLRGARADPLLDASLVDQLDGEDCEVPLEAATREDPAVLVGRRWRVSIVAISAPPVSWAVLLRPPEGSDILPDLRR